MTYALSADSITSVRKMSKAQMSKVLKIYTQHEYRVMREIWIDTCTFTDFYDMVLRKGLPVTRVDAYIANVFIEKYHNTASKHKLED